MHGKKIGAATPQSLSRKLLIFENCFLFLQLKSPRVTEGEDDSKFKGQS